MSEQWKAPMPMGVGRNRIGCHIQGVALTPWGWAFSRNGVDHGQLIIPAHKKFPVTQFHEAHAGGIDAAGDTIAIPLYDHDDTIAAGHLCLWKNGLRQKHHLPRKPYAVGIAQNKAQGAETGFICAIVSDGDGSSIDWWNVPEVAQSGRMQFIGRTVMPEPAAPRNNVCLLWQGKQLVLYAMRAYTGLGNWRRLGRGRVTQYAVSVGKYSVQIKQADTFDTHNNGMLHLGPSSRFGATVVPNGTQGGVDYDLIRTARNIRADRLLIRRDRLYTAWS